MRKCFSALIFVLSILISASCSWASLEFLGEDLTDGYVGEYYSDFLVVDGKRGTITWSGGGGLPPGLSMSGNGDVVYITGTPTTEGFYTFTIRATDSIVGSAVAYCSIIIDKLSVSITSSFSTGIKNTSYSSSVKAKYGTAPYTWSNEGGEIPPGLTLSFSGDEAKLSGTPTKDGLYTLKLKVTDKTGATYSRECSVVIRPLEISGKFTESTMELDTYSDNGVKVVGGTAPFTWNVIEGTLPPGLKVTSSGSNALLSGTPTEEGRYTFTLEVSDAEGKTATKSFTVSVNGMYIDGKNYDITGITAKNATLPVTWKLIRGFLPLGLSLPSSSG
ncbi:MAG: putative Ig domain-containing protein, partial [Synergistaceae bacterium]|nr:putative Ig domain-containing protein [Synergistaceae bacterium]